ncbi:MAG: ABC transporter ATP-binding protein [Peptococcia bacterium]
MSTILEAKGICKYFGGLKAVDGLSFKVEKGSIAGLIGPNGAGKSTAFNCLTGTYPLTSGNITFNGQDVTGKNAHQLANLGLVRTYQNNKIFPELTVYENILMGADRRNTTTDFKDIFGLGSAKEDRKKAHEKVMEILEFTKLTPYKDLVSKNLAHGIQRYLAIATALACEPILLLMDEPATGLNPEETSDLMDLIKRIRNEKDTTVLLIEHDMKLVMNVCEFITVINFGQKLAEGVPKEISSNPLVIEAYLGRGSEF